MIRVFVVDDHEIIRFALRKLIGETPDMVLAGEAIDGGQFLSAAMRIPFDVLVLDLSLPRVSGAEVLRRMRQRRADLPVVVFSVAPENEHALRLLRSGASAYLSKERLLDELLTAIRTVAGGRPYITDRLAELMLNSDGVDRRPHEQLSRREYEVFSLIIRGRSVSEIAAEIDVTPSTVSNHLHSVKQKLGAHSIADVIRYAHGNGLAS